MSWPTWIDELKTRYLANEGNAFVLHGAVHGPLSDDEPRDCIRILREFLAPTRPVVGVLRPWPSPSRIDFSGIMDRTRFENLVKAHELVEGHTEALQESVPTDALARIWKALQTSGTDQAFIVADVHRLLPGHRKRMDPIPGAPPLVEWGQSDVLTQSNNIVFFLTPDLQEVRSELLNHAGAIRVGPSTSSSTPLPTFEHFDDPAPTVDHEVASDAPPVPASDEPPPPPVFDGPPTTVTEVEASDDPALPAELDTGLPPTPEPTLVPHDPGVPEPDQDALVRELTETLARTVLAYDEAGLKAELFVMDAVHQVVKGAFPDRFGELTFSLDDDDKPRVQGAGDAEFLALWRSDITLSASASRLVRELGEDGRNLDETAISVLAKRIAKLLTRLDETR